MRHPIVIVGGGVAALGAAVVFRRAGVPCLIIEGRDRLGGRMASLRGEGWVADTGCPYFSLSDTSLMQVVREAGLDVEAQVLMGAVARLSPAGKIEYDAQAFGANRVSLKRGMGSLFDEWSHLVTVMLGIPVGALRWDERRRIFLIRDNHTARAVCHPVSRRTIEASGIVLAVPGTAAQPIVRATRFLQPIEQYFEKMTYREQLVGVFKVPRINARFAVLHGNSASGFEWLCLEEKKHPSRVAPEWSVITAWASNELMDGRKARFELGALEALYGAIREALPELPEHPIEQHMVRWNAAHPREESLLGIPDDGVPTSPPGVPFALAGDYTLGKTADAAAESGMRAARQVLARI